jgi:hypothetical protein
MLAGTLGLAPLVVLDTLSPAERAGACDEDPEADRLCQAKLVDAFLAAARDAAAGEEVHPRDGWERARGGSNIRTTGRLTPSRADKAPGQSSSLSRHSPAPSLWTVAPDQRGGPLLF